LKETKNFNSCGRGLIATAHMNHMHLVSDTKYNLKIAINVALFEDMQTFMYAVLQEHLNIDKGKSLVSQFGATRDAQSIYQEFGNYDDTYYSHDDIHDSGYEAYHVDTDILHILMNNTNTNCFGSSGKFDEAQATFLPRDEWNKLT
jgi:hypothetical protein